MSAVLKRTKQELEVVETELATGWESTKDISERLKLPVSLQWRARQSMGPPAVRQRSPLLIIAVKNRAFFLSREK